jgi:hypothetical protein
MARIAARTDDEALRQDIGELREAVGLEQRETYDRPEGIGRSGSSSLRACRPPFEINRSARRPR